MTPLHLVGKRFSRLLVLSHYGRYSRCQCDCGQVRLVRTDKLKAGTTRSCGCLAREMANATRKPPRAPAPRPPKKSADERRLCAVWNAMVQRCHNPSNADFPYYGARGIEVCARWRGSRGAFLEDMLPSYRKGLWLEREDNDLGYSPENCVFRTPAKQARNRRNTIVFPNGALLANWCSHLRVEYQRGYRAYCRAAGKAGQPPNQAEVLAELQPLTPLVSSPELV